MSIAQLPKILFYEDVSMMLHGSLILVDYSYATATLVGSYTPCGTHDSTSYLGEGGT